MGYTKVGWRDGQSPFLYPGLVQMDQGIEYATTAINGKEYGVVGGNTGDQGPAINAAMAAAPVGGKVFLPAGTYRVTTPLVFPNYIHLEGEGDGTTIVWAGTGTMASMLDTINATFSDMRFFSSLSTFLFFDIDHVFTCFFNRVRLEGTHSVGGVSQPNQTGIRLSNNAGDNQFMGVDFLLLGTAVKTGAIMDFFTNCMFRTCQRGVWGEHGAADNGAGIALANCVFTSVPTYTISHLQCDVMANRWWVTNCWMEGSQKGIVLGASDFSGGPLNCGVVNTVIDATVRHIEINRAWKTLLAGIHLADYNSPGGPSSSRVSINSSWASDGTAMNIISSPSLTAADFPASWVFLGDDFIKVGAGGLQAGPAGGRVMTGTGVPEGAVTAAQGSLYLRTDGGSNTTLYVKQSGTVATPTNTGWAAK